MGDGLLTGLSIENYHPSTFLSMDSGSFAHEELEREMNNSLLIPSCPPDINLPLSSECSPPPVLLWNDTCDILDVTLGPQIYEAEAVVHIPKASKKCMKRLDSIWGAWFFFTYFFKPVLNDKSKCKITRDGNGVSGYEKLDLELDAFLVQHDIENMYMWVFKGKPENALGKMQLRSYMNGHSRQGQPPFPFSADKGFVRSHRMQRKHYRGLSNPQCIHGIEVVHSPNLTNVSGEEKKKWMELTCRDLNLSIPPEASDFGSWRNLTNTEFETTTALKSNGNAQAKKLLNGSSLNLSSSHSSDNSNGEVMELSPVCNKRKRNSPPYINIEECLINNPPCDRVDVNANPVEHPWLNEFNGVMKNVYGPVTAAKTIYEDDAAYLILISLPFADLQRVKVTWRNTTSQGIVKVSCISVACTPFIRRNDRTFKLTDPTPEHCPPGEFVREIPLPSRIPEDAKLEAYRDETGTLLEVIVPKYRIPSGEHEVRVCLRPSPWNQRALVNLQETSA